MIFQKKMLFNCFLVTEQMYIVPRKIISNSSAAVPNSYKSLKVKASKVDRLLLSFTRKFMKVKKWSLQWTQFLQLCKEAWKKFRSSMGFKPMTSRLPVQCSTNWAIKPLTSIVDSYVPVKVTGLNPVEVQNFFFLSGFFTQLHKLRSLRRSFLHFHFISAVHIWFISYIINNKSFTCFQVTSRSLLAVNQVNWVN